MIRETPPHYWGRRSYPARWWKQQDPSFFPKWQWWLDRPLPEGWDPLFDRGSYQDSLFNDAVLPSQYTATATLGHSERALAEKRMLLVMLDNARTDVETYLRARAAGGLGCFAHGPYGARRFQEDWDWIFSDDEEATFSFLNVCFWTQSDPVSIRTELLAYEQVLERERTQQTPARQEVEAALRVRALRQKKAPLPELVVAVSQANAVPRKRSDPIPPLAAPVASSPAEPEPPAAHTPHPETLPPCPVCGEQTVGLGGNCACGTYLYHGHWLAYLGPIHNPHLWAWDGGRWQCLDPTRHSFSPALWIDPCAAVNGTQYGPGLKAVPVNDARALLASGLARLATREECLG